MIPLHLRLPCPDPLIPCAQLHTALCHDMHTAAHISGSVSEGFDHSSSLSHRNILQHTKEELGCLSLNYHRLSTHVTNHFPLSTQFGWYWLQLIETITDLSIINGSLGFASGSILTRKKDANSSIVTLILTLQKQYQISEQN